MENKTALDCFYENIMSHFEHDGDLLETVTFSYSLFKIKERQQHGNTWDAAIQAHEDRGYVISRSLCDFDEYEIK